MEWKITLFSLIALLVPTIIKSRPDAFVEKELYQPIDVPSPSPINVILPRVKFAETATPLQTSQGLIEILNVTNTGKVNDHSTITGGILGKRMYKLDKIRIYLNQNPFGRSGNLLQFIGGPLEPTVIYREAKYPTLKEALKHPGGVVQLSYCVITGLLYEPKFAPFQKTLEKIKEPGSSSPLRGAFSYIWFDHFALFHDYFTYRGSYQDVNTGKLHYGITQIIASPQIIGLSLFQFKAFQELKGDNGKPLDAIAPLYPQGNRTVFLSIGVQQKLHLV
ncbi:uncharacterized protein LOC135849454 isoform X2 [Planococcus citri]|uniref:uncharacterized protein LOC135849454 isoform X2 n=1 Tax=Planococcus citri TaxID=170843 RepID=UPI0031F97DD4